MYKCSHDVVYFTNVLCMRIFGVYLLKAYFAQRCCKDFITVAIAQQPDVHLPRDLSCYCRFGESLL